MRISEASKHRTRGIRVKVAQGNDRYGTVLSKTLISGRYLIGKHIKIGFQVPIQFKWNNIKIALESNRGPTRKKNCINT